MDSSPTQRKQRAITSERIDTSKPASRIVDRFGGLSNFCRLTGFPTSTVHGWMERGFVPTRVEADSGLSYQALLMRVAKEQGIELEATDFIEQSAAAA